MHELMNWPNTTARDGKTAHLPLNVNQLQAIQGFKVFYATCRNELYYEWELDWLGVKWNAT